MSLQSLLADGPAGLVSSADPYSPLVNVTLIKGDRCTLTLTNHDDNRPADPTYTLFDDVSTH